jgi:hypothetical protein
VKPEDEMATDSQNGYIIVLSFPNFFFNNDGGRAEDQELGQSVSHLADPCWEGALYGVRPSDSCVLVGVLTAVLQMVLERLIFLEVQLVKLLISNSRHVV